MVNVSAKDRATNKEQKITITASSGLSKDEVDRMMKEAESHAVEDKARKDEIETRNHADQAVYGAERLLKENGDKIAAGDRQAIESAAEALRKAISSNDVAAMTTGMDALTAAQHRAAESMYKQAGSPGDAGPAGNAGPGAQGGGATGADGVIDAEVVDDK
jgi:molecular chaperone DnaK